MLYYYFNQIKNFFSYNKSEKKNGGDKPKLPEDFKESLVDQKIKLKKTETKSKTKKSEFEQMIAELRKKIAGFEDYE